jgi:hypothetical protein
MISIGDFLFLIGFFILIFDTISLQVQIFGRGLGQGFAPHHPEVTHRLP